MHWTGLRYMNTCVVILFVCLFTQAGGEKVFLPESHVMSVFFFFFVQYIVESARQRPARRRVSSSGRKSLYQKLYELYMEECEKEPELKVILARPVY